MAHCKIYLENYSGTYYAGSEVRGRIECFFNDETTLRGVKIRMKCKEHNEWTDSESYLDTSDNKYKTRWVTFTGDNCVVFLEQMLFGSDHGSTSLQRGKHVFPFNFTLPETLPSTFNGPYGSIFYRLKAIVDRPMRTDYEDTFVFHVQAPIDFNLKSDNLQEAVTYSDEKTLCCWCCKGGNITMDVELPKTAFVPGEAIDFKVIVTNLSNESVEFLKVKLIKTLTFHVNCPSSKSKEDVEDILNFREHGVGAHGEHVYDLQLQIPDYLEVPNFSLCNLFSSCYKLEVTCGMPSCTVDLDVNIYPELGHIARGQSNQNQDKPDFGDAEPYPPTNGTYPPPAGGAYPPPPGTYPSPIGGAYPPPAGGPYPPPAGGAYPPPVGGVYPPQAGGSYPPPAGAYPPTSPSGGAYPPSYSSASEKPVYPGGAPTAPFSTYANAPPADVKAREASGVPTAPTQTSPEMPPPSYNQIHNPPYPPNN